VADQFKPAIAQQMFDIGLAARKEVVYAYDFVTFVQQALAQMRA
jgi:hypothetical protein